MKPKPSSLPSNTRCRFIVATSVISVALLCVITSVNRTGFNSRSQLSNCINPTTTLRADGGGGDDNIRVFLGILTVPDKYRRRDFLRQAYGVQKRPPGVDIKFVFCNLATDEQRFFIALEILRYDDIIILNCTENMDEGKTFTYFSSLPSILANTTTTTANGELRQHNPLYHYVMKIDDDSYFRFEPLVRALTPLPRQDLYYGFVLPCESMNAYGGPMTGSGYLLSWDLVEWFEEQSDKVTPAEVVGPEDKVIWRMLNAGQKGKNRVTGKWGLHDFPDHRNKCSHKMSPESVGIHLLKTPEKWIKTLRYFNVTRDLKPSKLYHIEL